MNNTNISFNSNILQQHMQLLGNRLDNVFKAFHSFENKYFYGGMLAVIVILNTDLIFAEEIKSKNLLFIAAVFLVASIVGAIFFWRVSERLINHQYHFRSLKYHYELTYYAILLNATLKEYLLWLEKSLQSTDSIKTIPFPEENKFDELAEYLYNHHRRQITKDKWKYYLLLPVLLIFIVMVMKIVIYVK